MRLRTYDEPTQRDIRMSTEGQPPEIRDLISLLWLRKWWIIVITAVVAGLVVTSALTKTPTYASQAEVLILPVNVPNVQGSISSGFILTANELRIAESGAVSSIALKELDDRGIEPGSVSVSTPTDTDTMLFNATAYNAASAQATAQAWADAYLKFRHDTLLSNIEASRAAVDEVIAGLNAQIVSLQRRLTDVTNEAQIQALQLRISSVTQQISTQQSLRNQFDLAANTNVGEMLQPAFLPAGPSRSNVVKAGVLGLFVGLLLGIGAALLRDRLDQHARTPEAIEVTTGSTVVGVIPKSWARDNRLIVGGDDLMAAEAFRTLRTHILYTASQRHLKVILVTSAEPGEGKTTTAANLGAALAQTDTRVVLVSADLRRPALHRYFPSTNGRGLTEVLSGTANLHDLMMPTTVDHLRIVPSGSRGYPEGSLGSDAMIETIKRLSEYAEFVILDSAPVLSVSDTLDLASLVDGVILVADAQSSSRGALAQAANDLRSVGADVIGVVVNRYQPHKFEPYYRRHYYQSDERAPRSVSDAEKAAATRRGA
jgi:capsular exopolysaccharide synthesis family protein